MPQDLREKRHLSVDERHTFKAANTANEHAEESARILEARDTVSRELPRDANVVREALNAAHTQAQMGVGLDTPATAGDLGQSLQGLSALEKSRRIQV